MHPHREQYVELVRALRDEGYDMCVDLYRASTTSPTPSRALPDGVQPERFEVVVNLLDLTAKRGALRLRVQVPDDDPTLPSLFDLYPGTEAMEREVFDMFGIRFDGPPRPHPHPHARGLGRPPAAQGLRGRAHPGAVQGARGRPDERGRSRP